VGCLVGRRFRFSGLTGGQGGGADSDSRETA
jgi:hypothetical protein